MLILTGEPTVDFISSSTLDGEGALQSLVSAGHQVERQLESREVKIERQKALRAELARAKKALFYDKIIFAQKMEQLDQIKACREQKEQMAKKCQHSDMRESRHSLKNDVESAADNPSSCLWLSFVEC